MAQGTYENQINSKVMVKSNPLWQPVPTKGPKEASTAALHDMGGEQMPGKASGARGAHHGRCHSQSQRRGQCQRAGRACRPQRL